MKKGNVKGRIYRIVSLVLAVLFVICAIWLIRYFYQQEQAKNQLENMQDAYIQTTAAASTEQEPQTEETTVETQESLYLSLDGFDVPEKIIDFKAMQEEECADIYAWITVPGTAVDYPVVQHPEEADYYLNHNLDGSKGYPGGIYTQFYNSKDWDDTNTVIYGHNMGNGTMFASLHNYEDPQFFEENPYVYLYLEDGRVRVYQIFAAYEYSNANLVTTFQLLGEEAYEKYLKEIYELDGMVNNFSEDIEVTAEDTIITLETCINQKPNLRYLVQAVLVAEG